MTSASVGSDVGSGYTIVTKVVPSLTAPAAAEQNSSQTQSQLQNFLKGEPKALGVVQIMIGVLTILFGIVKAVSFQTISVYSGVVFWGSLIYIGAGSLAVSASNNFNACVVKATLGLNIFSIIAALFAISMFFLDLVLVYFNGISLVLLIFSLLQFVISLAVMILICKSTGTNEPTEVREINHVASSTPPMESPPAYCEVEGDN
ncbi:membrane-spanning 4-domains subfamily A member 15-like isoform X2 [Clarias gariepinus]|uniref:membrane-spanning 4-domains subfamily A member 15-like isoform X2 n=1 Tax=Clarias gariepinus TaxID=13013 RepID=UPI00234E26B2|nr:membrane-spanning 4-domains subfamily A member 15-like isoform X2 [Clarias gariepinus]